MTNRGAQEAGPYGGTLPTERITPPYRPSGTNRQYLSPVLSNLIRGYFVRCDGRRTASWWYAAVLTSRMPRSYLKVPCHEGLAAVRCGYVVQLRNAKERLENGRSTCMYLHPRVSQSQGYSAQGRHALLLLHARLLQVPSAVGKPVIH